MLNPVLDNLSTKELLQKKRFSTFALITVWLGAIIAIAAALYVWSRDGILSKTTLYLGVIALMASFPVYQEKKRITKLLKVRNLD